MIYLMSGLSPELGKRFTRRDLTMCGLATSGAVFLQACSGRSCPPLTINERVVLPQREIDKIEAERKAGKC